MIKESWLNYRMKYTKELVRGEWCHTYSIVGAKGALHFWWQETSGKWSDGEGYGGVETHYRQPPSYMDNQPPSHSNCPYLNGVCWHDGSSLAADKYKMPHQQGHHEYIFTQLIAHYDEKFNPKSEDDV